MLAQSPEQKSNELDALTHLPEYQKTQKRKHFAKRMEPYTKFGKRVGMHAVVDPESDCNADSDEASARLLENHWKTVFAEKSVNRAFWKRYSDYIPKLNDDIVWKLTRKEFDKVLDEMIDSGVGPDGLPYSAWIYSGSKARDCLYWIYE